MLLRPAIAALNGSGRDRQRAAGSACCGRNFCPLQTRIFNCMGDQYKSLLVPAKTDTGSQEASGRRDLKT